VTKYSSKYPYSTNNQVKLSSNDYGAIPDKGIPPFQIRILINKELKNPSHNHMPLKEIMEYSDYGHQRNLETQCLINPNDIQVFSREDSESLALQPEYRPYLINLYFCYVDIDCTSELERLEAIDAARGIKIGTPVIARSGNGIHVYWAIKPINMLRTWEDERDRQQTLETFIEVQLGLASYFNKQGLNADMNKVSPHLQSMRVIGTWNIKDDLIPKPTSYIQGDIAEARANPSTTLKELHQYLREEGHTPSKQRGPAKRPRCDKQSSGAALTKIAEMLKRRLTIPQKRYLSLIWGMRHCRFFFEGTRTRKLHLERMNGLQIKEARELFIAIGFITYNNREASYKDKIAAQVQITDKFYETFKIKMPHTLTSEEFKNDTLQQVANSQIPKNQSRTFVQQSYNKLKRLGCDEQLIENTILTAIRKRPNYVPTKHDKETLHRIRYLRETYKPIVFNESEKPE